MALTIKIEGVITTTPIKWSNVLDNIHEVLVIGDASDLDIDQVYWQVSNDGTFWGINAPNYNDNQYHLMRTDDIAPLDGDLQHYYKTSLDTTNAQNGTNAFITTLEGVSALLRVKAISLLGDVVIKEFVIKTDLSIPPVVSNIRIFKDELKTVEFNDGDWVNVQQPFLTWDVYHDNSSTEGFSYTFNGVEPDTITEKSMNDPTYNLSVDPDPSN